MQHLEEEAEDKELEQFLKVTREYKVQQSKVTESKMCFLVLTVGILLIHSSSKEAVQSFDDTHLV